MQLYAKKIKFIQSRLRKIFAFIYNNLKKEGIVMSKTKKSKILAAALCTAVMAGIYASPVMAGTITGIPGLSTGDDEIVINGVTLKDYGTVEASQGHFANAITLKNGWLNVGEGKFFVNATDGNTEIKGTLQVTGDTTLGALTANGLADLQGGLKVTGDANLEKLNVNGKLTVDATSGVVADNLTVDNNARVQGDLTVENALTAGETNVTSLTATGVADLQGGLKVTGDTTLQKLSAGATTVGSLETTSGKFIVNTDGYTVIDNQLDVTGLANVGELTAAKAGVTGDLQVFGQTTLNGLTVTNGTETDTLKVTGDTELAGLTAGNTTVNGTLNAGATTVDSLKSNGNAEVGGTLDVTGKATLKGGLAVTGGTETDTLNVTGAATVGSLKVAKDAEIGGNANVKGELYAANNKFGVDGDGNIRTTGSANIGGSTTIGGLLTVTDNANITGNATVGGGLGVTGNATVGGGLGVTGNATVGGTLNVTDLSTLGGGLTVSGQTKLNNDLTVNGSAEIDGNLKIGSGNFTVDAANGNTVVKGSLHLGSLDNREVGKAIKDLEAYADELKGAALPDKVGGIERDPAGAGDPGNGTTIIEGMAKFDSEGMAIGDTVVNDGKITVGAAGNQTVIDGGAITTNTINAGGTIIDYAGMTVGDTVVNDSKITVGAADDQTIIEGGAITAKSLVLDSKDVGKTIAGIDRTEDGDIYTTTIEGALEVSNNGLISNANSSFKVDADGNLAAATLNVGGGMFNVTSTGTTMNLGDGFDYRGQTESVNLGGVIHDIDNRLDDLEYKTQNIKKPDTGTGTGAGGASGLTGGEDTITVPDTAPGHTGITGDVTVGGEINAGEIVVGDKGSDNKTTIDGGNVTVNGGENGSTTINGGNITTGDITAGTGNIGSVSMEEGTIKTGDTTINDTGITTGNGNFTGDVDVDGKVTVGDGTTITGEGITTGTGTFDDVIIGENTTIDSEGINTNDITAGSGTIGNVDMDNNGITVGGEGGTTITKDTVDTTYVEAEEGNFSNSVTVGENTTITDGNINLGGEDGTNINADGMIVGNANSANTNVSAGDVVITDKDGNDIALSDVGYVENIDRELQANGNYDGTVVGGINAEADIRRAEVNRLDNRIDKVEDRVDKVGAMAAAIANLRTMGYDPAAPTEIAVGIGQYRSETGAALGLFHYPNKDFMLSLSVSTSGDEVMGGIGATWKFGRKSPEKMLAAEKEKAAKAKLAKAEAMKKAAVEAKVAAQQAKHAKMAAEKAAK